MTSTSSRGKVRGPGSPATSSLTRPSLDSARELVDALVHGLDVRLEVDGGVGPSNIAAVAEAGADTFVAGSAIFGKPDYAAVIQSMRDELAKVK